MPRPPRTRPAGRAPSGGGADIISLPPPAAPRGTRDPNRTLPLPGHRGNAGRPPGARTGNVSLTSVKHVRQQLTWLYNRVREDIDQMCLRQELVPTDYYRAAAVILDKARDCIADWKLGEELAALRKAVARLERGEGFRAPGAADGTAREAGEVEDAAGLEDQG